MASLYVSRIANAIMGRECFVSSRDGILTDMNTGVILEALSSSFLTILFILIIALATAYGSFRLSYCYNISIGNVDMAILYGILCFFFPHVYYPYYAIFLNPLCSRK